MSNTKHTPGPWEVTGNPLNDEVTYVFAANDSERDYDIVADISSLLNGKNNDQKRIEREANAKLIAAAPELKRLLLGILKTGYHSTELGNEAIRLLQSIGEEI